METTNKPLGGGLLCGSHGCSELATTPITGTLVYCDCHAAEHEARFGRRPIRASAPAARPAATVASKTCRKCGQTAADGAMFTTGGGGNVCDDCF